MPSHHAEQLVRELHASLGLRKRPEDIAQLIQDLLAARQVAPAPATADALEKASQHSLRRLWHGYTSMLEGFAAPVGAQRQLARATSLFASVPELPEGAGDDPAEIEAVIRRAGEEIHRQYGEDDFGLDRLNRTERSEAGIGELSKRQYNKRFRLLRRMEVKLARLMHEQRRRTVTMTGKGALAHTLPYEVFGADPDTAAFIAYLTARAHLRSVFTNGPQRRPYDEPSSAGSDPPGSGCTRNGCSPADMTRRPPPGSVAAVVSCAPGALGRGRGPRRQPSAGVRRREMLLMQYRWSVGVG